MAGPINCGRPAEQELQAAVAIGLEFSPALRCASTVCGPGMVADADETGYGKKCLAGNSRAEYGGNEGAGVQPVPPPTVVLGDVAVESAGGPDIGRKARQAGGRVEAREMEAVVPQEDPEAISGIGVTVEIGRRGRRDLYATT